MMTIRTFLLLMYGFCFAVVSPACAVEQISANIAPMANDDRTIQRIEVLEKAGRMLVEGYVIPEVGVEMAAMLTIRAQEFVGLKGDSVFVERVTNALQNISNDRHLRLIAPGTQSGLRLTPENEDDSIEQTARPPVPKTDVEYRVIDNRIGYLRVSPILPFDGAEEKLAAAILALRDVDEIIIDMRDVPGGAEDMVQRLSSYFYSERTHLVTNQMRGEPDQERWTIETLPGPRLADQPLFVLISGKTASGAESFTLGIKSTRRGVIVGETTYGAGHFGWVVDVSHGYQLWLPRGRTIDPRTGAGWEGTGVTPDIRVAADDALTAVIDRINGANVEE